MENVLGQGIEFMMVGMSVVFSFLTLMIIVMNISAFVSSKLARFFPEEIPEVARSASSADKARIAAVIAIAKAQAK